jgi:hypothetical protein
MSFPPRMNMWHWCALQAPVFASAARDFFSCKVDVVSHIRGIFLDSKFSVR